VIARSSHVWQFCADEPASQRFVNLPCPVASPTSPNNSPPTSLPELSAPRSLYPVCGTSPRSAYNEARPVLELSFRVFLRPVLLFFFGTVGYFAPIWQCGIARSFSRASGEYWLWPRKEAPHQGCQRTRFVAFRSRAARTVSAGHPCGRIRPLRPYALASPRVAFSARAFQVRLIILAVLALLNFCAMEPLLLNAFLVTRHSLGPVEGLSPACPEQRRGE